MTVQGQQLSPILQRLRQEAAYGLTAIQFLTRLRVPQMHSFQPDWIHHSVSYFPAVGMLVGAIAAGVMLAASTVWPSPIAAILAVGMGILITGALHEDGLADTADGLAGGHTREQRLAIMKDSRIGTFGAAVLIISLALKAACLAVFVPGDAALALLAAHAGARVVPVVIAYLTAYAGDSTGAKVAPLLPTRRRMTLAIVLGLLPFALLPLVPAAMALLMGALAATFVARAAVRAIGGYTGDVLGAAEQVFEVGVLLILAGYAS